MSMMLMAQAMGIKVGNPTRKLVLLKLADNANDNGKCWPSYEHIADMCEIDRRTAMRHIKILEQEGLVKVTYRKGEKGNSSNIYQLYLGSDKLSPPSDTRSPGVVAEDHQPSDPVSPRTSHRTSQLEPIKNKQKDSVKGSLIGLVDFPKELNQSAWMEWLDYRRKVLKKPYKSTRGEQAAISKLLKLTTDSDVQKLIVDQSIDNEWAGLFEYKSGAGRGNTRTSPVHKAQSFTDNMDKSQYDAPDWMRGNEQ